MVGGSDREVEGLRRELDTLRLDAPPNALPMDAVHRVLEMDVTGWFAFDGHGSLAGFDVVGMSSTVAAEYRRRVIRSDRPWEFFDPWTVPGPQRDRVVACQAVEFLQGKTATRRRLGLHRTTYERVRQSFEQHSYGFYERYGLARLWQLRAVITDGPRFVGWFGGLCDREPTRTQRQRIQKLLPSVVRRTRYLRAATASGPALVESILEQLDRAAFVVASDGRVVYANGLGRAALEEPGDAEAIRAAARSTTSPRYDVVAVRDRGMPPLSLVIARQRPRTAGGPRDRFTKRQADVVDALCMGASNREIGHRLRISERTVEVHLTAIYDRLGVDQRAAAIARLLQGAS